MRKRKLTPCKCVHRQRKRCAISGREIDADWKRICRKRKLAKRAYVAPSSDSGIVPMLTLVKGTMRY